MDTVPHDGDIFKLCDAIRETSVEIHRYLRSDFTEKIYENALANRLRKQGIRAEQQQCVRVFDEDGTLLGLLRADILSNKR
jgi:GxxExxY protein